MKFIKTALLLLAVFILYNCQPKNETSQASQSEFQVKADRFEDFQILRYQVPGFDSLDLNKKKLVYYLYQAALSGRDMFWDQNYKYNLLVRKTIEGILNTYNGDRTSEDFKAFETYAKMVFVSNGLHHPHGRKKILPKFNEDYFTTLVKGSEEASFPLSEGEDISSLIETLKPIIFDPNVAAKSVDKSEGVDIVQTSATNFYEGVTQAEVEQFYKEGKDPNDSTPPLYGLNSKVVKGKDGLVEKTYKLNGFYTEAIEKIVYWLKKASEVAENAEQKEALDKLITFYETGDLDDFDDYCVAWVKDVNSAVDNVNGFIEVYDDPLGLKGSYEAVVSIKDQEASERMAALSANAQWFEDHSPLMDEYKKENVTGISYKVITVVVEAGGAAPNTPIGINLPNSDWIRAEHGSKSVSLGNIKDSYEKASTGGSLDEFFYTEEAKERAKKYGTLSGNMHTALHEVIGHASGKLAPGIGTPSETLKNYSSALEEARADLVSLYFIVDPKLVEIGIVPNLEVGKAEYDLYITNGLQLQLRRLKEGEDIEEAHMRNRQLVAQWAYEQGIADTVIERITENNKTYFVIRDYDKLREIFGNLLREIQRIKSEGDYEAGKNLIETYAVKVDQDMLKEVKERYSKIDAAPYSGFIQPRLVAKEKDGEITDVKVEYPDNFLDQMLEYGKEYSFLPVNN